MSERAPRPGDPAGGVDQMSRQADAPRGGADRGPSGAAPPPATQWTAEQRYRWLVATAAEGIWRFEIDLPVPVDLPERELAAAILERGRLAECNPAYARQYGFEEPHELVGVRLADRMSGSYDEQFGVVLEFVRSGFQLSDLESQDEDRAGRPFLVRKRIIGMVENGRLVGGWGTQRDITGERRAEEGSRASNAHLRSLVENVSDVVTLMDADGTIRFESPSVERVFGYRPEDLVGRNAFDLLHPDDLARVSQDLVRLLQNPDTASPVIELRARHQDGSWCTFEVIGKCLAAQSGPPSIVMTFRDVTGRRRTDDALKEAEWKFQALFERGPIGVAYHEMVYDASGQPVDYRFLDANERYRELTGVDPRGLNVTQAFPGIEHDPFDWIRTYGHVARSGEQVHFEQYLQANDRWYDIVAYQYKPDHFVTAFLDITERKRTEQSLRLAQYSVEIAADAVFWLRPDASVCYANVAAARLLGYSREELLRLTAFDLNPGRSPENWAAHWDRIRQQRSYTFEAEFRSKAGDPVPVEITAGYLEFGGEVYNFSFVRDITERKRTAERLATLAAAVEQAADDIMVTDAAGIISYVNSAFERTTGYPRVEAVGRSPRFLDSGRHDPAFYDSIDATIASGRTWHGRFSNRTRDGRVILQDASISPILDASGGIVGQVSARRDVTRQVELEEHAAQADKLEAIGTMAGGIAHDFNNILSAILGYTQMALRKCPEDSAIQRDLQAVLLGSRRAADLVKQILTFSRHQQSAEQRVQVGLIVKEAVKFLRATIPATVEIRTDIRSDAVVLAEPTDLHRIVINLCTNAALAMQDHGGLLELSLAEVDLDAPFASKHPEVSPGRFARLTVRDTGHGMTREVQARIFEPFFTTRQRGEGTGMGLAVVHGIITRCRGAITVQSEPGQGTTFGIHLPLVDPAAPAVAPLPEPMVAGSGHILVVDDEPLVATMVADQLNELGYRTTACANGAEALEAFAADPRAIDLVVTDMTMPGMTGDVLAQRLKSLRPDLPVVLCTGYSDRISQETAQAQGIDEFGMKPVAMAELSRMVRRALDRHRGERRG
jgi:PAS domain S-box-containing protein